MNYLQLLLFLMALPFIGVLVTAAGFALFFVAIAPFAICVDYLEERFKGFK